MRWPTSKRLEDLIKEAQKLSPLERLRLISAVSQSLHHDDQRLQPWRDFWRPQTLEQHIQRQQTQPLTDISDLQAGFWPAEEPADDIIAYIYQQRERDRLAR